MRSIREKGKTLGDIYEDSLLIEKDPLRTETKVFVRNNVRYGLMLQMDIRLNSWPEEGEHTEVAGDIISKIRGGVSWRGDQVFHSEVVLRSGKQRLGWTRLMKTWPRDIYMDRYLPYFPSEWSISINHIKHKFKLSLSI